MRTTKTISVSLPPRQLKEMEQVVRRENRTLSELVRESFRRYQQPAPLPTTLAEALGSVREDAKRKGVNLTQREINAEIAAVRWQQARKKSKTARPMIPRIVVDTNIFVSSVSRQPAEPGRNYVIKSPRKETMSGSQAKHAESALRQFPPRDG
jgi:Arc/MetJ-type ribon-helix-helix transcriptional regulator